MGQTHDKWIKGSQYQKTLDTEQVYKYHHIQVPNGSDHQIHIIRLLGAWKKASVTYLQPWKE
jgi:hypothetical protein